MGPFFVQSAVEVPPPAEPVAAGVEEQAAVASTPAAAMDATSARFTVLLFIKPHFSVTARTDLRA